MPKQGLPRNCRMTERHQFVRLFDKPNVYRAPTFQAFWKEADANKARLGITLKGRLSSIWRTRLKRIVREWFRTSKDSIGPNDLNIVIKIPPQLDWDFADRLRAQLRKWKA